MDLIFEDVPSLRKDIIQKVNLDVEMKASGFAISKEAEALLQKAIT